MDILAQYKEVISVYLQNECSFGNYHPSTEISPIIRAFILYLGRDYHGYDAFIQTINLSGILPGSDEDFVWNEIEMLKFVNDHLRRKPILRLKDFSPIDEMIQHSLGYYGHAYVAIIISILISTSTRDFKKALELTERLFVYTDKLPRHHMDNLIFFYCITGNWSKAKSNISNLTSPVERFMADLSILHMRSIFFRLILAALIIFTLITNSVMVSILTLIVLLLLFLYGKYVKKNMIQYMASSLLTYALMGLLLNVVFSIFGHIYPVKHESQILDHTNLNFL
jgi:hypothetical protein